MLRIALVIVIAGCPGARTEDSPVRTAPPEAAATRPAPATGWIEHDPATPLAATLGEQAALAVRAGKKPHAYLHADWCTPCNELQKSRNDPKMQAAFAGTHIIAIDIDRVPAAQLEAAGMAAGTIPVFYRLDGSGRPTGASITGAAWGDNIPDNMAPPLTAFFQQ